MPPDYEDFPLDVQLAILTYGKLGDKIVADIGYLGKDMTTLPLHIEINGIQDKELFIETILRLDELAIKKSNAEMKRHREKLASKAKA